MLYIYTHSIALCITTLFLFVDDFILPRIKEEKEDLDYSATAFEMNNSSDVLSSTQVDGQLDANELLHELTLFQDTVSHPVQEQLQNQIPGPLFAENSENSSMEIEVKETDKVAVASEVSLNYSDQLNPLEISPSSQCTSMSCLATKRSVSPSCDSSVFKKNKT